MKSSKQILLLIGCFTLLIISWVVAAGALSASEKQLELLTEASPLIEDLVFIKAVPILEEAAGYNGKYILVVEEELKKAYLALIKQQNYRRKYTNLLEKQMNREDAQEQVFAEAADYYLGISKLHDALEILKSGIEKTNSETLTSMYETHRYAYEISSDIYEYSASIHNDTAQVQLDGLWGLASQNGKPLIPCQYEKISTFSNGISIVKSDGEVFAVDIKDNRIAKLHEQVKNFGNYAQDRIPFLFDDGWRRATGEFVFGLTVFEGFGMYSDGFAPAKSGGKWGVIDIGADWLIPPEYDELITDDLGRCYARGAVFAKLSGTVYLIISGERQNEGYEDARPFSDEGFAAVKRGGKWGFIDISGKLIIDFIFDDALSFGQHLAAVKKDDLWGYIGMYGTMAIEPVFLDAKSFSGGSAPVLTEKGWQFITLIEYKQGLSKGLTL